VQDTLKEGVKVFGYNMGVLVKIDNSTWN